MPLLLEGKLPSPTRTGPLVKTKPKISKKVAKANGVKAKRLPFTKLYQKLQHLGADKSKPAPSLGEVAEEVGYPEKSLHKDFPQLTRTIETNYHARRHDFSLEQRLLEEAMHATTDPPPSMQTVAQQLGRSQSLLKRHFPAQYAAIVVRHQQYRQQCNQAKQAQKTEQIRQSVQDLAGQGVYPSASRVGQQIGDTHFMFKAIYAAVWRESLDALGYLAAP